MGIQGEADSMLKDADMDGDKRLNYEEFFKYMKAECTVAPHDQFCQSAPEADGLPSRGRVCTC